MNYTKDEQMLMHRMKDLIRSSYQQGYAKYSGFLSLAEQNLLYITCREEFGNQHEDSFPVLSWGGYEEAERKMFCFLPERISGQEEDITYPLCCIKISFANRKYGEELSHRDYLGTLMGLGFERDQIGDIIILRDNNGTHATDAYVFCVADKADLILEITRIRHTTVKCELVDMCEFQYEPKYKEIKGSVASLRLDAVLSIAIRTSRNQGLQLIRDGNIYLNGRCCTENAKILQDGDIISVRGHGKYLLQHNGTCSKKGRCQITVKQYI